MLVYCGHVQKKMGRQLVNKVKEIKTKLFSGSRKR